ncbi:Hypothetical protein D9617_2g055620 [Elsinoe fawcettii]|nr:Hypothetical protein D9617_2g055620 [Elsinoe fawcettii]
MASSPATRSLAGETMVDDLSSMMSAIHVASSPTQRSFHKGTPASHQSWNTQDALDDTFMENGAAEIIISPASERAASPALTVTGARTQVTQQDLSTFPLIVQPLIVHLIERGHEALLPITWKNDFPFLPPSLFPPTSDQIPMISSLSGSDFRAQKQFTDLLGLGALARDKTLLGKAPESALAKNIEKYILWAIKDAGLMQNGQLRCPELLIAAAAGKDTGVDMLQHILAEKMDHAEGQWRAWLGDGMPLPCFYGLAVSHSMVVIAIYESDGQVVQEKRQRLEKIKDGMQSLGMFDFSDKGLDVWNALAVALLAVHVRDVMRGHAF